MLKFFCLGIPKSGTCTIKAVLERDLGWRVAHSSTKQGYPSILMTAAHREGRDPVVWLPYDAFVHPSNCAPEREINHWPQMDLSLLQSLRDRHPGAVFCLNTRKRSHLVRSITEWKDQRARYRDADIPGLPAGVGWEKQELSDWIDWHWDRMRTFFAGDDRFVEIDIENGDQCKAVLSDLWGVTIKEWPWLNRNVS